MNMEIPNYMPNDPPFKERICSHCGKIVTNEQPEFYEEYEEYSEIE